MRNLALLNFYLKALLTTKQAPANNNAGFTLIEMIVVVAIIGILGAIAAPSWLALVNQQRIGRLNDVTLRILQQAQSEAKKTKVGYSVTFKKDTGDVPRVAIYPASSAPTANSWQPLGQGLNINTNQAILCSNIVPNPTNDALNINKTTTSDCDLNSAANKSRTVTFDYLGNLPTGSSTGLKITVKGSNTGAKRCVIVQTLLGSLRTDRDTNCN